MCRDYYVLQFMDPSIDTRPIAPALAAFFDNVLDQSISQLNFKAIVDGLGGVLFKYPFRVPGKDTPSPQTNRLHIASSDQICRRFFLQVTNCMGNWYSKLYGVSLPCERSPPSPGVGVQTGIEGYSVWVRIL